MPDGYTWNLAAVQDTLNWTRKHLADVSGVHVMVLKRLENQHPTAGEELHVLVRLYRAIWQVGPLIPQESRIRRRVRLSDLLTVPGVVADRGDPKIPPVLADTLVPDMESVWWRVRPLLHQRGASGEKPWSLMALGRKIGLNHNYLYQVVNGRVPGSVPLLAKIAPLLVEWLPDVTLHDILVIDPRGPIPQRATSPPRDSSRGE